MKHLKVLSNQKPAQAAETAWVQLKDIICVGNLCPGGLNLRQGKWLATQVDQWLQK
ncbi:MAG: hypothetical protein HY706_12315 [Candidatus Hydrogenedentes bacterium]|nr:hypothetical protein [Candidatus Hydrogenedentota bacterium]